MNHDLKTDPQPFQDVLDNLKTFEIRKDDRPFVEGDTLTLRETKYTGAEMKGENKPLIYTGRVLDRAVTHILRGPIHGLQDGWVILSIK